jgi:hypothetical protein
MYTKGEYFSNKCMKYIFIKPRIKTWESKTLSEAYAPVSEQGV